MHYLKNALASGHEARSVEVTFPAMQMNASHKSMYSSQKKPDLEVFTNSWAFFRTNFGCFLV